MFQTSIKYSVRVDGVNVYNGRKNYAVFHPGEEDSGIVFRTRDGKIDADLAYAQNRIKSIWLYDGLVRVRLVEHLLSAVYALGIDNVEIELSDGTCPTTDNCAQEYVQSLKESRDLQTAKKRFWRYSKVLGTLIDNGEKPDSLEVCRTEGFAISYSGYYPHKVIGKQNHRFEVSDVGYEEDIMSARAPAFIGKGAKKALITILGKIFARGANGRNYLLVGAEDDIESLNPEGFGVRYDGNEFIRHKILDVMGTLALTGRHFLDTEFMFKMTGHNFDLHALRQLFKDGCFEDVSV